MVATPQNRIRHSLSSAAAIDQINSVLDTMTFSTRLEVSREICELFGFRDHRGRHQVSCCMTILTRLERAGHIKLPPSKRRGGWKRRPVGTGEAVPEAIGVPDCVGEVSGLELSLIGGTDDRRLWNELMLREHPQGDRIITGRQLRYFVRSDHGILGALGVSASALHLEARDKWIGWDWEIRQQYLDRVICLSRFLIRPNIHCRNLASKVLGMFVRCVGVDFESRYGYDPWLLESFIDTTHHTGTCYRAANWTRVGCSKGRGRYDSAGAFAEAPKDIYLYCLRSDLRSAMGLPADAGAVALGPADGLDGKEWAENEFGGARLGDKRLSKRLVTIAAVKARNTREPFADCASGENAHMQGYHRFIEYPDRDAVNMEAILEPHLRRTIKRMRREPRILCPQDTTVLDYAGLKFCDGLGPTGANRSGTKGRGLRLHSTLAVTPEGLPLGILKAECIARKFYPGKDREKRRKLPFKEKEGFRWLESIMACEAVSDQLPGTRLVCVMDREADIFELFDYWGRSRKVDLLVRAAWNRGSDVAESLFAEVKQAPINDTVQISLPGRRNRKRRLVEPYADLQIRYKPINLQVPTNKRSILSTTPVPLWAVYACEPNPPTNTAPIKWFLFSTENVDSTERAQQCLREYSRRWRIEEWHKVLKSGCKVQDIISDDAETIRRVVAINMVIAWRVMLMTLLHREQPDLPPQTMFSDVELQVLARFAEVKAYRQPDTAGNAIWLLARLGGYRARSSDPPPGIIVIWRGCTKLEAMAAGAALFLNHDRN